jgi:type IV secretion system protein VirB9
MARTTLLIIALSPLVTSCATKPPVYVKAQPLQEPPKPPAVVEVPRPMPLPGQLRPVPVPRREPPRVKPPCSARSSDKDSTRGNQAACNDVASVISSARVKALQNPDQAGFFNAIMTYDFVAGALFQVYTAPLKITAIQLQPGEKILGKPVAGDTVRWISGVGRSAVGGVEQQIVYIKPTRAGLDTTLVINTDRRTYFLELHSFETDYMAAVEWRYPQDEIAQLEASAARQDALDKATTSSGVAIESLNFRYEVKVQEGRPVWTPVQVFDDGRKTYIRFPAAMLVREAPALFVLSSRNETQLVNYRVKNEYYVVDRLIETAELRVGQQKQEVVRIYRR